MYLTYKLCLPLLHEGATLASPNPNTHIWLRLILIATFALLSVAE